MNAEFMINNFRVLLGGMLVFVMHLGFAMLEAGLCRAKNCTNILFKVLNISGGEGGIRTPDTVTRMTV